MARLNSKFLEGFVRPHVRRFGWIIWGAEAAVLLSFFLDLFCRLGGLVAIAISRQLGLCLRESATPTSGGGLTIDLMVLLSLVMFAFAQGRVFGLEILLRPRLLQAAKVGNRLANVLTWLT